MLNRPIYIKVFTISLALIFLSTSLLKAQFMTTGSSPASIKWSKLKGENYTVIYPTQIDSLAKRYLWLLESNRDNVLKGLNINPKRTPVILHPYTANSNGMVTWAPKRMELYTQPQPGSYAQPWDKQLVLHESRHVGQISHFSKGVYSVLGVLLGEQIYGGGLGLYSSTWFLEGDAVIAETELSNSGRGREASFLEYYRASQLNNKERNWDKWRYGSYKYFTPDIYKLGYVLNSNIRYKSGLYDYAGVDLDVIVKKFYKPWAANQLDKSLTGVGTKENLQSGLNLMDSIWRADLENRGKLTTESVIPHKKSKYYSNYTQATPIGKDSIVYVKKSYNNSTQLVLLTNGDKRERVLRVASHKIDGLRATPNGKKIYFTEVVNSTRWELEAHSNLYCYNLESNKIERLSKRESFYSPALNSNADSIAVVKYHVKGGSSIVLLSSKNGKELESIKAPYNAQITEFAWIGNSLYSFILTGKGIGLFKYTFAAKEWETIINEQDGGFYDLKSRENSLYFSSGIDGVSNIYEYNVVSNEFKRLTNSKMGLHEPTIMGDKLYASRVGLGGYEPVSINLDELENVEGVNVVLKDKNLSTEYRYVVAEELARQARENIGEEDYKISLDTERDTAVPAEFYNMQAKRYSKVGNLFHVHSWAPVYYNINKILNGGFNQLYDVVSLGATVYSQNLLGTATTMLGYSYNGGYHAGHFNFKYSGLYPVFEVSADVNSSAHFGMALKDDKLETTIYSSPLVETSVTSYIPFNFSSNGWLRELRPTVQWAFNNNTIYNSSKSKNVYRNQVNYALRYYQMLPTANSAIFPKWGVGIQASGATAPFSGNNFGEVGSLFLYGYVPGIGNRQGLKLTFGYQRQFADNSLFYLDNLMSGPRGMDEFFDREITKVSADYAIPIYLGDISLSWVAYLKRLQLIPFADYAMATKGNSYTYGADIMLDAYFLRIGVPVSVGVRLGINGANYELPYDKHVAKLLFNISL